MRSILLTMLALSICGSPAAVAAPPAGAQRLVPDRTVSGVVRRSAPVSYLVPAAPGLLTVVDVRADDGELAVDYAPVAARRHSYRVANDSEAAAIYFADGPLRRVTLRPLSQRAVRFSIRLRIQRGKEAADQALVDAQAAMVRGWSLEGASTDAARQRATEQFLAAAQKFEDAGDEHGASTAVKAAAEAQSALGDKARAAEHYERAAALCARRPAARCQADNLLAAGTLYDVLGKPEEGRAHFDRALTLYQEAKDTIGQARVQKQRGELEDTAGDTNAALARYELALGLFRAARDRDGEAQTLSDIGVAHQSLSQPVKALTYYRRAAPMFAAGGDRQNQAVNELNMGVAYEYLGDADLALVHHRRALATLTALRDETNMAYCLHGIGAAYRKLGNDRLAEHYIARSLRLFIKTQDVRGEVTAQNSLGRIYLTSGRPREALHKYQGAFAKFEAAHITSGSAYALSNIGDAYTALREPGKARDHLDRAIALFQSLHDKFGEGFALHRRARLARDQHDFTAARRDITAALTLVESFRARLANEDQAASYFASVRDLHEFEVDLLAQQEAIEPGRGYAEQAFESSDRYRARSLLEALSPVPEEQAAGTAGAGGRLGTLRQQIRSRMQAQAAADANPDDAQESQRLEREIETLIGEYEAAQAALNDAAGGASGAIAAGAAILRTAQSDVLEPGTVLIEYMLGDERSYAWFVSRDAFRMVVLPRRRVIETAVQQLVAGMSVPGGPVSRRTAVTRLLLGPFASEIRGKRLVVSADGAIQMAPFATLAASAREVTQIPSVAVMGILRQQASVHATSPRRIAVFADPVYDANDSRIVSRPRTAGTPSSVDEDLRHSSAQVRGRTRAGLARLAHSADEAQAIARLAPPGSAVLMDFQATKTSVLKTDWSQYQIAHFAVHGLMNSQNPELSGLALSLFDEGGRAIDGFLRLADIGRLRVPAALVVLSACETARGRDVKGEGLASLTRGFLRAGASRVVASLWQVSDASTERLMRHFYQAMLIDKLSPAAALRKAQDTMRLDPQFGDAYFWAGFSLYGDWR